MRRGQIALEFIMLLFTGMVLLFVILTSLTAVSSEKADDNVLNNVQALGMTIQQELLIANEMENGYHRSISVPQKLNGREYTILTGNTTPYRGYLIIEFKEHEFFYFIPTVVGNISHGITNISKENGTIYIK